MRVLALLIPGFPSSIDSTGVRATCVLPSVDGGFFCTTDLHASARVRSLMARSLCLVSSSEIPTTRRSLMISSCCCDSLVLHSRHACLLHSLHSFALYSYRRCRALSETYKTNQKAHLRAAVNCRTRSGRATGLVGNK